MLVIYILDGIAVWKRGESKLDADTETFFDVTVCLGGVIRFYLFFIFFYQLIKTVKAMMLAGRKGSQWKMRKQQHQWAVTQL